MRSVRLDRRVFGADRRATLEFCWRSAPDLAWIVRTPTGIAGFALGRHGHDTDHIGPIVAAETDAAIGTRGIEPQQDRSRPSSIDVPDDQHAFAAWIRERGFALERPFTRMTRGTIDDAGLQVAGVRGGRTGVWVRAE